MASAQTQGNRDLLATIKARNEASAQFQQVGRDVGQLGKIAEQTQKSMRLFAASVVAHRLGAGLTAIGQKAMEVAKRAFDMAKTFDQGMRQVRTQTTMTDRAFGAMQNRALALAKTIPLPIDEISEGLYDILSSMDVNSTQAIKLTAKFSRAAVAGATDIRSSTRAAIGALNAYSLPLSKANLVLDQQFALVKYGIGTYEDFIGILGDVYPSAYAAQQSLASVGGALAFTTRNGLNASKAGISVARALDMITRPQYAKKIKDVLGVDVVDEATGKYRQINEIIGDMAGEMDGLSAPERKGVLADIFGAGEIRAFRFFNIAIPKFDDLNNMIGRFSSDKVAGSMMSAFEIMEKGIGNQIEKIKNHLHVIGITLASTFFPVIRDLLRHGERLLEWFESLPEPVQRLAAQVLLLGGAFALVGGRLLTFAANIMGARALMMLAEISWQRMMLTIFGSIAQLLLIGVAIVGIGFAVREVIEHWDEFSAWWRRNWENIAAIATVGAVAVGAAILSVQSYLMGGSPIAIGMASLAARWKHFWMLFGTGPMVVAGLLQSSMATFLLPAYVIVDDFIKWVGARFAAFRVAMAAQGGFLELLGHGANQVVIAMQGQWSRLMAFMSVQFLRFRLYVAAQFLALQLSAAASGGFISAFFSKQVFGAIGSAFMSMLTIIKGGFLVMIAGLKAVGAAALGLLLNPWTYVVAAIVALVYVVIKNWESIKGFFVRLFSGIAETAVEIFNGVKDFFIGFWNATKTIFIAAGKFLWSVVKVIFYAIVTPVIAVFKILIAIFKWGWNLLFNETNGALRPLVDWIVKNWDEIQRGAADMAIKIIEIFTTMTDWIFRIVGMMVDGTTKLIGLIPGPLGDAADDAREDYHALQDAVLTGLDDMKGGVENWKNSVGEDTEEVNQKFRSIGVGLSVAEEKMLKFAGGTRAKVNEWNESTRDSFDGVSRAFHALADDAHWTAGEVEKALKKQFRAAVEFKDNFRTAIRRGLDREVAQDLIDTLGEDAPRAFELLATSGRKETQELIRWLEKTAGVSENVFRVNIPDDVERTKQTLREAKQMVDGFVGATNNIKDKNMKVTANTEEARRVIDGFMGAIDQKQVTVSVRATGTQQFHSGGIVPGSGDIPALLKGGEYVIRDAQATRFLPLLEKINRGEPFPASLVANLAKGTEYHNGGLVTAMPSVITNLAAVTAAIKKIASSPAFGGNLVAVGRQLQQMAFRVSGHAAFGGTPTSGHSPGSYHYINRAIDFNYGPGGASAIERAAIARVLPALQRLPYLELLHPFNDPVGHGDHGHLAMALGGIIREPIFGLGLRSLRSYSFGEQGDERVVPMKGSRGARYGGEGAPAIGTVEMNFHDARVDPKQAMNELYWLMVSRGY